MRTLRARAGTVVAVVIAASSIPVGASGAVAPARIPLTELVVREGAEGAERLARDLLAAPVSEQLLTTAAAYGIEPAAPPATEPAPLPGDLSALPREVAGSVVRLWTAVTTARTMRDAAFADLGPAEVTELLRSANPLEAESVTLHHGPGSRGAPAPPSLPPTKAPDVDLGPLVGGALVVLEAIEAELPVLEGFASASTSGSAGGSPPLVDLHPHLAVDLDGDTDYDRDYTLVVDLGGNDRYAAGAGTGTLANPVGVVVDVTGDDVYELTGDADSLVAQGAAVGGIGVLVDVSGDDTYTADNERTVPDLTPARSASVVAQGAGSLGVGVLADGGGDDTFEAVATTRGGEAFVAAQGAGATGVGLLSRGPGPVTYRASSTSGLLMTSQTPNSTTFSFGPATTVAQGGGVVGAGAIVDSLGDGSYTATAHGVSTLAVGQGGGRVGAGIAVDGGGADAYTLEAEGELTLELDIGVDCPPGFICHRFAQTRVNTQRSEAVGQGGGATGAGVSADLGTEDNARTLRAASSATAIARIALQGGLGGIFEAEAEANNGDAVATGQGAGDTGAGLLLAGAGSDTYHIDAASDAIAVAEASGASTNTTSADANGGDSIVLGQGFARTGAGGLLDLRGDDSYEITQSATASFLSNAGPGTAAAGDVTTLGRAYAMLGVAALVDLGGSDTYSPLPGGTGEPGGDDMCWSNAEAGPTSIGLAADVDGLPAPSCVPPPVL